MHLIVEAQEMLEGSSELGVDTIKGRHLSTLSCSGCGLQDERTSRHATHPFTRRPYGGVRPLARAPGIGRDVAVTALLGQQETRGRTRCTAGLVT